MSIQQYNPSPHNLLSSNSKTLAKGGSNAKTAETADASLSCTNWKKPPASRTKKATCASKIPCGNHKVYFIPIICSQNMKYWLLKHQYLRAAGHKTLHFKIINQKREITININTVFKKQYLKNSNCQPNLWECVWRQIMFTNGRNQNVFAVWDWYVSYCYTSSNRGGVQ